jgi:hypothetical protein
MRFSTPWLSLVLLLFAGAAGGAGETKAPGTAVPVGTPSVEHWSLQPIRAPRPPAVKNTAWPRNGLDHFILARLEQKGLAPAPEANRERLIRRLFFDLTGLPPSPAEVDAFVRDPSPRAYEQWVERLLASPRYGERWGRHWLDVARYTESQGFEYDKLRDQAWHYRDYVIQSFNQDKPYDQFMREQVAGDVLEPVTTERIVAASLLVCGPWDEAGNSQANATQRAITREDELEDILSVVGQTFLGLTLNCARCHSHKFDPITIDEYYRLKSIFDGVKHGERVIAAPSAVQRREQDVARRKESIATLEQEIAAIEASGWKLAASHRGHSNAASGPVPTARWDFAEAGDLARAAECKGGARIAEGRLELAKAGAYLKTTPLQQDVREKTLEVWVMLTDLQQGGGGAIALENSDGSLFDAIVFGERQPRKWLAGSSGFARTRDLDAPEETSRGLPIHLAAVYRADNTIALFRNGEPYGQPYRPDSPLVTFKAGEAHLLFGMRHQGGTRPFLVGSILGGALYDRALSDKEVAASCRASTLNIPLTEQLASLDWAARAQRESALARIRQLRAELEALKPLPVSYAGTRLQPPPTHRLKRGDVKSPEDIVAPGVLSAIRELPAELGLASDAPEGQRRLAFAQWLADPRHPLPARVMANRVWHLHFGQGLVATPNDFGAAGARPSHPELLDWLATQFIASGWSTKALHRLLVTSATYRQSSAFNEQAAALDADNTLLWRFTPRRLEAEILRDAMLAVSGQLNLEAGGPSFRPFEALKFPANAYVPMDKTGPEFNRRSVYRMNVNSGKEPLMDAFDCPDPAVKTPRRGVTTTPLQALGLMNNSFVQRQAKHLADAAQLEAGGERRQAIALAYRRALGRSVTADEAPRAAQAVDERGLEQLCWVLFNSTEFIYVQ